MKKEYIFLYFTKILNYLINNLILNNYYQQNYINLLNIIFKYMIVINF